MSRRAHLVPRTRRGALACVLAGLFLVLPLAGEALADTAADAGSGLGGYSMSANGNGAQMTLDNPAGLGGSHPIGYFSAPEASATLETGPTGHALATLIWPGALLGNLGSTSNLLPIPDQLKQALKGSNDPVRAEANAPGGPADANYPPAGGTGPVVMKSHADSTTTDSLAEVTGLGVAPLLKVGTIVGHGLDTLTSTAATATGTSTLTGVDILGGLLHIDSIASTANATTDGTSARGTGNTVVSGVSLLNGAVPASIDDNGLHIDTTKVPVGGVLDPANAAVNQLIQSFNLNVKTLRPANLANGAEASVRAPAVIVTYNVPNTVSSLFPNIPGVPNVFQNGTVTIALAGATASVNGSPAFAVAPLETPAIPPVAAPTQVAAGPATSDTPPAPAQDTTAPSVIGAASPARTGGPAALAAAPIGLSKGLTPLLMILAATGAVMMASGLRKLSTDLVTPRPAAVCPREDAGEHGA